MDDSDLVVITKCFLEKENPVERKYSPKQCCSMESYSIKDII